MILFVNPDQEALVVVNKDTSTGWPISVLVACIEESISFLEDEMVLDK